MTSVALSEPTPFSGNPIDLVEEIVSANDWAHDRASEEELVVEISGRWCEYRLYFVWQEEICAMHFSCGFDMKVPKGRRAAVYELLALANEKLWLGHFDLSVEDNSPAFRHASCCAASWRRASNRSRISSTSHCRNASASTRRFSSWCGAARKRPKRSPRR